MSPAWWEQINHNTRQYLSDLGFNPEAWESLRQKVLTGEISKENNYCLPSPVPPSPEHLVYFPAHDSDQYHYFYELGCHALAAGKVGVAILNGGMATRWGGVVKGAMIVDHERSFLQLKLDDIRNWQQRFGGRIPVFIVNSFATDEATREHLKNEPEIEINYLQQGVALRLTPDGEIFWQEPGEPSLYAPGHGDMVRAWQESQPALEWCREEGRILLLGNVDNIFYNINPAVIGIFMNQRQPMLVETVEKLPHDIGGAPAWYQNRLQTIERFRFPPGYDQNQNPVFATNTFVIRAEELLNKFQMDWFYVLKEAHGRQLLQLEKLVNQLTARMDSTFLVCPRQGVDGRFMAVKTAEDIEIARKLFVKRSLRDVTINNN